MHYFLSSETGCEHCSGGSAWLGPLLFSVVLGVLSLFLVRYKDQIKAWESWNRGWLNSLGERVVAFLITTQIIVMLKINHERYGT